jgi:hypothetical protein
MTSAAAPMASASASAMESTAASMEPAAVEASTETRLPAGRVSPRYAAVIKTAERAGMDARGTRVA